MKKNKIILLAIIFSFLSIQIAFAQGCSDAGFCTVDSFKPDDSHSSDSLDTLKISSNQLKIGAFIGKADNSILVFGKYIEYSKILTKKFVVDAKLTSIAQNGNEIFVYGISDAFINANYRANDQLKITLGGKIPLSNANRIYNNLSLPMDYQQSLGTFDLIFGIGTEIKNIQLVAAIQQPLTQNNNQFIASTYSSDSKLSKFQSTNSYKRAGDVLLRVSYPLDLTSKIKFTPSILPIYHLTNDKYTDEINVTKEIIGSKGLTLNGNIYLDYRLNKNSFLQFNLGVPFLIRESRPDGLTRSFVANVEYRIKF
jgi:hypothetical protein